MDHFPSGAPTLAVRWIGPRMEFSSSIAAWLCLVIHFPAPQPPHSASPEVEREFRAQPCTRRLGRVALGAPAAPANPVRLPVGSSVIECWVDQTFKIGTPCSAGGVRSTASGAAAQGDKAKRDLPPPRRTRRSALTCDRCRTIFRHLSHGHATSAGVTRREREILNVVFALGNRASADEIRQRLADPPSHSSVRVMLARLEQKGLLRHAVDGVRFVYSATRSPAAAGGARSMSWCRRSITAPRFS